MKNLKRIAILIAFITSVLHLSGQQLIVESVVTPEIIVNGSAESFEIDLDNASNNTITNGLITVILPDGIQYVTGSFVESTSIGLTEGGTITKPTFTFSSLSVNGRLTFTIQTQAVCTAIGEQLSGTIFRNEVEVTSDNETANHISDAYNILYASLSILSVSPKNPAVASGAEYTQAVEIINGGNGKIADFELEYELPSELTLLSSDKGIVNGNKILLSSVDISTAGNMDGFFDQDEKIVVNVTLTGVACQDKTVSALIKTGWDDASGYCQSASTNSNVSIDFADPVLTLIANPSLNTCFGTEASIQELQIVNTGSGVAASVVVDLFKSSGAGYDQNLLSSFDINTVQYKKGSGGSFTSLTVNSSTATTNSGEYSCLGASPKGQFEVSVPNIEPGETLFLQWEMQTCCPSVCSGSNLAGWETEVDYSDACAVGQYTEDLVGQDDLGASMSLFTESDPDVKDGQEAEFTYVISSYVNDFPLETGAKFTVNFDVPVGFDFESNSNLTWNSSTTYWSAESINFNSSTRVLSASYLLDAPFNISKSEINLKLRANCAGTTTGFKTMGMSLEYDVNPSCVTGCAIPLLCDEEISILLECPSGDCDAGISFSSFELYRISLGGVDNDDNGVEDGSGAHNEDEIKRNRAMTGDTIAAVYKGIVNTNGTYPIWDHAFVESVFPLGGNLTPVEAQVIFYDQSSSTEYIGTTTVSRTDQTNSTIFKADLSPATVALNGNPSFSGLSYGDNDSLRVIIKYRVSGNIGAKVTQVTTDNDFYTSDIANPTGSSNKFQCDDHLENITLIGHEFSITQKDYITAKSCSQKVEQTFRLSIGNCCSNFNGGNLFPYEYRNWASILEAKVLIPDFYVVQDIDFFHYRTSGTNGTTTQRANNISPDATLGDTMYFDLSQYFQVNGGSIIASDDGFSGKLVLDLKPNCDVPNKLYQDINWYYNFDKTAYLDGGTTGWMNISADKIRYNPTLLTLTASNPQQDGIGKYVTWDVAVKNPFSSQSADNVFLYFDSPTGDIQIYKVIDKSDNSELTLTNDLYLINSLASGEKKNFQVFARYTACSPEIVYSRAGYACDVLPTDYSSFTCPTSAKSLKVTPKPAQLQVQITGKTIGGDCSPFTEVEIQFASVQLGAVDSIHVVMGVPATNSILQVVNTSEKLYPLTGSWTSFPDVTLQNNEYSIWVSDIDNTIEEEALVGVTNTAMNKIKMRFQVEMQSNFEPGDFLDFAISSESVCDDDLPVINVAYDPSIKFERSEIPGLTGITGDSWSVSWADYNDDGFEDIFVTDYDATVPNSLYTNNGDGTFTAYASAPITTDVASSIASTWGDYDNDGDLDLFVANNLGSYNFLYSNDGDGTFTKITTGDIVNDDGYSHGASWGDYNGDGFLDLIVTDFMATKHNLLYKNNGDGTFERDLTAAVVLNPSKSISPSWADIDGDRDLDLFIANYGTENALYENIGNGKFKLLSNSAVTQTAGNSAGASWADVDNDQDLDLYVTYASNQNNEFFLNNGDGTFVAQSNILTQGENDSHGSTFADFNNDGLLDLFVTNDGDGMNNFFTNTGGGQFVELETELSKDLENSFGTATGDIDNDGDADLFVANHSGEANAFYLNTKGACLSNTCVNLVGLESNKSAIGAKVFVTASIYGSSVTQMREISAQSGGGTGSQNSMKSLFGLGDASIIDQIKVEWPSGITQILTNQPINNCLTITEQSGSLICGTAYNDKNNNCIQDSGEEPIANQRIYLAEKDMTLVTDSLGNYQVYVEDGSFSLAPQASDNWTTSCSTVNLTVTGNGTNSYCGNDFGFSATCALPDVTLAMGIPAMRRGFSNDIILNVTNIGGSSLAFGTLTLTLPPGITALESDKTWSDYTGNIISWDILDLGVNETEEIILRDTLDLSIQTGDNVTLDLNFSTSETECDITNNSLSNIETIVGAIDPNEKYVHPMNDDFGYTFAGQDLNYKILFQNEGTYYATNVTVVDIIDEGLDIETLREVVSSHNFTMEVKGREVTFRFRNIMLPTKDENEEKSQGFIQFKITPKADISEEYEVHNTAGIIFDFEDPIYTNTVKSKMSFIIRRNGTDKGEQNSNSLSLFPLPVSSNFTAELEDDSETMKKVRIIDVQGKEVFKLTGIDENSFEFNNGSNLHGIHIVEITTTSGEVLVQKVMFE